MTTRYYYIVPAEERPGSRTQALQVVDEKENVIESFYFDSFNREDKARAYDEAFEFVDELKRQEGES